MSLIVGERIENLLGPDFGELGHHLFFDITTGQIDVSRLFIDRGGLARVGSASVNETAMSDHENPRPELRLVTFETVDVPRYVEEDLR